MKKLSLELDQLRVESFVPGDAPRQTGTVVGHATNRFADCWTGTQGNPSDFALCLSYPCGSGPEGPSHAPSCGATCNMTGNWKCQDGTCVVDW